MTQHSSFPPDEMPADSHQSTADYIHRPRERVAARKVHVVGGANGYACWMQGTIVDSVEEADLVVFSGGEDVDSAVYGRRKHFSSYSSPARDRYEIDAFKRARALGKPMFGTCRGHQLLAALNGAILVQDQQNRSVHPITLEDGSSIVVTSAHHQAVVPWHLPPEDYRVIGWTKGESDYHWGENDGDELVIGVAPEDKEIEIMYWPKTRCLGTQGHPEWQADVKSVNSTTSIAYHRSILNRLLDGTL